MSRGSTRLQFQRLALASIITATIAGCSTDNSADGQAPITAIGASGGAPASSTVPASPVMSASNDNAASSNSSTSSDSTAVPTTPGQMSGESTAVPQPSMQTSQPITAPQSEQQSVHTASTSNSTTSAKSVPVQTQDGKIVYNRNYGNIPKGSYSGDTYTVKHGDTLFYIAWITGNDFRDLAQKNNISEPYALSAGQVLHISNGAGQPITGANEISQADSDESNQTVVSAPKPSNSTKVAQQPVITYSDNSANANSSNSNQSGSKLLPQRSGGNTTTAATANNPTASSTSNSAAPIKTWRWPVNGKIIDNFSAAEGGNKGIDIAGSRGQSVVSTAAGRVVYAGNALRGYGNLIIIKHNDDYLSAYAHNDTMLVKEQQMVTAGQKIATMGSTGTSSVRLHFEIRYKGKSVNPLRYLPQR